MSKKIIKEVGEGSSSSFPYHREKNISTLGPNLEIRVQSQRIICP